MAICPWEWSRSASGQKADVRNRLASADEPIFLPIGQPTRPNSAKERRSRNREHWLNLTCRDFAPATIRHTQTLQSVWESRVRTPPSDSQPLRQQRRSKTRLVTSPRWRSFCLVRHCLQCPQGSLPNCPLPDVFPRKRTSDAIRSRMSPGRSRRCARPGSRRSPTRGRRDRPHSRGSRRGAGRLPL